MLFRRGTVGYANAPTPDLSKRGDRLHEGYCKEAMSTTGYANAPTPEFSTRSDRSHLPA
ncbi:hypothetical protein [Nostoc sp.]|uniref:hypothetical protein n=1 Tax=Nostoc sp. TaxID=1180 RepID=UPI002FF389A0